MLSVLTALIAISQPMSLSPIESDSNGLLRYRHSGKEVALFGVNYMTPFAFGYRQLNAANRSIDETIRTDVRHFKRLGLTAVRVHVWDREISDSEGNLLENDHLRLLDRLISECKKNDIYVLLTPITWYSNGYPGPDTPVPGFSSRWDKSQMGSNPAAVAASARYIGQFASHVNPYTQTRFKDDPAVFGFELCNEPYMPPVEKLKGYIETLAKAIRDTGCSKPLFYCASQSGYKEHNEALASTSVEGVTFGAYPTGLVAGQTLKGNYLSWLEDYPLLREAAFDKKAKIVYEYDIADVDAAYLHPAMAKLFRSARIQWATQFHYVSYDLALENTPYPTHNLNLVTTPAKAISLMIAAEVFRSMPRGAKEIQSLQIDPKRNLSEWVTETEFFYTADTTTQPNTEKLTRIVGCGSSPLVRYEGTGSYFLDRVKPGVWRLEILPNVVQLEDPYGPARLDRPIFDLLANAWPMEVHLPGLKKTHYLVRPGVYLLGSKDNPAGEPLVKNPLPTESGRILHHPPREAIAGKPLHLEVERASGDLDRRIEVLVHVHPQTWARFPMKRTRGYRYVVDLPADTVKEGVLEYRFTPLHATTPLVEKIQWEGTEPQTLKHFPITPRDAETFTIRAKATTDTPTTLHLSFTSEDGQGVTTSINLSPTLRSIDVSWDDFRPINGGWVLLHKPNLPNTHTIKAWLSPTEPWRTDAPLGVQNESITAGPRKVTYTIPVRAQGAPETLFQAERDSKRVLRGWPWGTDGWMGVLPTDQGDAYALLVRKFRHPEHLSWRTMLASPLSTAGKTVVLRAKSYECDHTLILVGLLDGESRGWATTTTVGKAWQTIKLPLSSFQPTSIFRVPSAFPPGQFERIPAGKTYNIPLQPSNISSIQISVTSDLPTLKLPSGVLVASIALE